MSARAPDIPPHPDAATRAADDAVRARARWAALFALLALLLMHAVHLHKLGSGYIEQQWVIDYASGFLRRGLFGELYRHTRRDIGDVYTLFRILVILAYLAYAAVVWRQVIRTRPLEAYEIAILLLTPVGWAYLSKMNGRFDLLFDLVSVAVLSLRDPRWQLGALLLAAVPLGLVHELWYVLYLPLLGFYFVSQGRLRSGVAALVLAAAAAAALSAATRDAPADISAVCSDLNAAFRALSLPENCSRWSLLTSTQTLRQAIDDALFRGQSPALLPFLENLAEFLLTAGYIAAAALPLLWVLHGRFRVQRRFATYFLPGLALTLATCVIALDWGRFLVDFLFVSVAALLLGGDAVPREQAIPTRAPVKALLVALTLALSNLPLTKIIVF